MGVVWQATDLLLGRRVAVKELPPDDTLSEAEAEAEAEARRRRGRGLREAQAVAQLRHPHVIVVHDVVEDGGRPWIVMELVEGESLAERIAAGGPLGACEAARIGADLLNALRTAHAAGVLHRDITPANVLIENGTGRVVLTDFGIARVPGAATLTESGSFVGSPEYTAPERMSGALTGPASDLWSVGALLCAALSGESPFRRDSLSGTVLAVVADEIRPPRQAAPILPVVQGLLERDPALRLDAAEAEALLREFLATGHARVPKRFSSPDRSPPDRPRPARRVLAAVALVAATAVAGVSAAALLGNGDGDGDGAPTGSASPAPDAGTATTTSSPGAGTATPATGTAAATATPSAGTAAATATPSAAATATPSTGAGTPPPPSRTPAKPDQPGDKW
ncbi:serine/threonine protein kinase [Streptomyces zinciresistens K42]|uniref:non-specific serine/threonine protein kinase n=2 Tax=Streptomyces TaxID=1883 RepID=G2GJC8_9ACTN|nr:serine/threonine protein kinase [Streptomyces zinciresistens K42]